MELLADLKVTDVATTSRSIELENRQSAFIIDILVKKKRKETTIAAITQTDSN